MDPRQHAVTGIDSLLSRARNGSLHAADCMRLVELVPLVPGRLRAVVTALAAQRDSASFDALMLLPASTPGVVEGLYHTLSAGVSRRRLDGSSAPRMLAIDFRHSRSPAMADVVARAAAAFDNGFERLRIGSRIHYRVSVREGRGTLAGRVAALAHDLQWLHRRLARLRGTRLWVNGWCFVPEGNIRAAVQTHLVTAWLGWASRQVDTRRGDGG